MWVGWLVVGCLLAWLPACLVGQLAMVCCCFSVIRGLVYFLVELVMSYLGFFGRVFGFFWGAWCL